MASAPTVSELLADLADEQHDLDSLVDPLDEGGWGRSTPAEGWAIRDQISHLAFFDEAAASAITDPDGFSDAARRAMESAVTGTDPMAEHLERGRSMSGAEVLAWWRRARKDLLAVAAGLSPGQRVPWFGPAMSPASFLSARLMETWAHGQDVADSLGVTRRPTGRLVHVAQLGVRARPFSFAVRGLEPPPGMVTVDLVGPDGERWVWDEDGGSAWVRGSALDFCLVVTQRRHLSDTGLVVEGDAARRWMAVAQAFAGQPGPGRAPSSSSA
ncbi:MAG TPA: TIGR03084 family protein [Acidimicrobiaceae bacterium]|nr:TIGR03084 family protein [Acidimicrobiaceae bacterium]